MIPFNKETWCYVKQISKPLCPIQGQGKWLIYQPLLRK
jgi:hypothetical protein